MNDSVRTWAALDIRPVSDLLHAALVDYDVTAVHERSSDDWRVFFVNSAERDRAAAALQIEFSDLTISSIDVPDENWAARSQESLRAVRVGHIVVAPPWDVPTPPPLDSHAKTLPAGDLVIVIQPSMGFGTGHHATTRLCIDALQRVPVRGQRVLDVGTGSGVLAIAASLLGAIRSVGIDDDADAIAAARENLELNPRAEVTLLVGDLRSTDLTPADIVVANLTGGLLISVARALQDLTVRNGRLVLSGLMTSEEHAVIDAFTPWVVEQRAAEDEWLCLTLAL